MNVFAIPTSFSLDMLPLGLVNVFGQTIEGSDLAVVALLVILEGVLSIDNALVLGLLAKRLPPHQRARALSYGLIGAFVFRVIAICTASLLLQLPFVKFIGGAYLVYIAVKHLFFESKEEGADEIVLDEYGHPVILDEATHQPVSGAREEQEIEERSPLPIRPAGKSVVGAAFWPTVLVIELTDVAFAVDSILAAMALAGSRVEKLWVVITGGIIGVVLMRFAAAIFIRLLEKFPRFEMSAYLLVIVIGLKLLGDWTFNSDWSFHNHFAEGMLGSAKPTFVQIEESRRQKVRDYEGWLQKNWPLKIVSEEHRLEQQIEAAQTAQPRDDDKIALLEKRLHDHHEHHIPHLLDFHDLRRPECMSFWIIMVVCFVVGFTPVKKKHAPASEKQK
jgi:YkoY family integral membrane protein